MDPRVENFMRRPVYQRVLVLVFLLVLLVFGFYYGLYEGQLIEMENLGKRLTTSEAKLAESRRIAANLPAFKAEYERLQAQLVDALSELPDSKEIPKLLRNIGKLAADQGLDVLNFTPAGEVNKGFYAEVPVDLKLSGAYHDVALFFDSVGNLPRIVNIGNLSMAQPKIEGGRTTLNISFRATTFRFIDK
ncbi:MAG: type 4a pilus biogenesis protein PilO [Deltaproteobacteria bacterium]|nr:type 4a pilus biogenesis protein PilO [Deltaproteobacteria bacterium]